MAVLSRTLHKKVLILILIVSIIPALFGTLQTYWGSLIAMDSTIGGYLEERTHHLARSIEQVMRDKYIAVVELARDPDFLSFSRFLFDQSSEEFATRGNRKRLAMFAGEGNLEEETIILAGNQGGILLAANQDMETRSFDSCTWWKAACSLSPGEAYMAENHSPGEESPEIVIAVPVPSGGDDEVPAGMLLCILPAERFFRDAPYMEGPGRWAPGVFSSKGNFIITPENGEKILPVLQTRLMDIRSRLSHWFPTQEIDNKKYIISTSTVHFLRMLQREGKSNCEWFTFIGMDVSDVGIFINLLMWRMSILGLVLVILLISLGLYLSTRIVNPIKRLHTGIREITAGKLDSRVSIHSGDELEDLADGFNDMAERLSKTYADLQKTVIEVNEKANHIALIHEITQAINSALDLDEIFKSLSFEMKKIVNYDYFSVVMFDEDMKRVYPVRVFPTPSSSEEKMHPYPIRNSYGKLFLKGNNLLLKQDLVKQASTDEDGELKERGMRSLLAAPLISSSGTIGFIILAHSLIGAYGEREELLVSQVAGAISVAVEHSRLYQRVMRFAEELEQKVAERTRELGETHKKLILTEKFAATGKLAASVAHEINNPLGIIKNYLKLFREQWRQHRARLDSLGISLEPLAIVNEELDRIARIVRGLLDLYRPAEGKSIPTNVNADIKRLIELMKKGLEKRGIQVVLELEDQLPNPPLSPDHIRQVILNILGNATDAMPEGGRIHIKTSFLELDARDKKYVEVVIEDTGCGIPPEIMGNIFDPFFTTKKEGEATGLGLAVTYGILQSMNGDINIASDPGHGTRVRILFPA